MNVIADTNVLLRAVLGDDDEQSSVAKQALLSAEKVVLSHHALCELAWVLRSRYGASRANITLALETLCRAENAVVNVGAYDAGMAMLVAGADFADGVIAYEGAMLGGDEFLSFEKKAVTALTRHGKRARLLA